MGLNRKQGHTIWLTGLSGSGKSTIANYLRGTHVILDGDVIRSGLCSDLGFSEIDRVENMRRLRELCKLFNDNGIDVCTAFISPFEEERVRARNEISECHIVYCKSSLQICEQRDVKGLYKKARAGEIPEFTGIDSPYEPPIVVQLILDTNSLSVHQCVQTLLYYVACGGNAH